MSYVSGVTPPRRVAPRARLLPFGEGGLLVELGAAIDPAVNARVHALARAIAGRLARQVLEVVPTYCAVLVVHDPVRVPQALLARRLASLVAAMPASARSPAGRTVEIPACYGGPFGPDLEAVAELHGMTAAEVVDAHSRASYRVCMLGFTPGFPYLGGMPKRLATPRLDTPRTRIPAGSIAIGGEQTGVYPIESPGGWRLVARTPRRLFDPAAREPFLLAAGDRVRFVPIDADAFERLAAGGGRA